MSSNTGSAAAIIGGALLVVAVGIAYEVLRGGCYLADVVAGRGSK